MDNLEKQLNKLPRAKMNRRTDWCLKFKLYRMIIRGKLLAYQKSFSLKTIRPLPVALVILLTVLVAVPGFAYASPSVTREHVLYPVKKAIEKVELSLPASVEVKAKAYAKMADRRLAEAEYLSEQTEEKNNIALRLTIEDAVELSVKAEEKIESENFQTVKVEVKAELNKSFEKK